MAKEILKMMMQCDNKGCFKLVDAKIDKNTEEVFCTDCGKKINNVSSYLKKTMISLGHYFEEVKSVFDVHCPKCKKQRKVVLNDADDAICTTCGFVVPLSQNFKMVLRERMEQDALDELADRA